MTASERNPFDVPRRVAEYIRKLRTDEEGYWHVDSVEYEGGRYVIDSSYEEDYGYFEPAWGDTWCPEVYVSYRCDVVEYVGRQVPVRVISTQWSSL